MEMNRNHGFTLIEVIVVLAILAVMAAMAIPTMQGWIVEADRTQCLSNRGAVVRLYLAQAAKTGYNVQTMDKAASAFKPLVAESSDNVTSEGKYLSCTGFCGNIWMIRLVNDCNSIDEIVCSKHGTMSVDGKVLAPPDFYLQLALKILNIDIPTHGIDSTSTNGTRTEQIEKYFNELNISQKDLIATSWAIRKNNNGQLEMYWSDEDIAEVKLGTSVRVIKYNVNTQMYEVGYLKVVGGGLNGNKYNIFNTNTQLQGDKKPSKDYNEILKEFNALDSQHNN